MQSGVCVHGGKLIWCMHETGHAMLASASQLEVVLGISYRVLKEWGSADAVRCCVRMVNRTLAGQAALQWLQGTEFRVHSGTVTVLATFFMLQIAGTV